MYVYLIVDTSIYQLPLAVCDSIKECADWLDIPYSTASDAIYNKSIIRKKYVIERVFING